MIKPNDAEKPVAANPKASATAVKKTPAKPGVSKATVKPAAKSAMPKTSVSPAVNIDETAKVVPKAKPAVKPVSKSAIKPAVKTSEKSVAKAPAKVPAKAPAKAATKAAAEPKQKKPKLVRDSFTMPHAEYQVLGDMKKMALKAGVDVKKSELLRVGVALIQKLDVAKLKEILASLSPLKAGRPKNEK